LQLCLGSDYSSFSDNGANLNLSEQYCITYEFKEPLDGRCILVQIRLNDPCEAATDHLFIIENLIIVWSAEARNIWNSHPPALQIRTSLTPSVLNLRLNISNRASNLLSAFHSAPQIRLLLTIVCVIYLLTSTNTETHLFYSLEVHTETKGTPERNWYQEKIQRPVMAITQ